MTADSTPEWAAVLGAIHTDKHIVLRDQLRAIAGEIRQRREVYQAVTRAIDSDLSLVGGQIQRFQPANQWEADLNRKDWLFLEGHQLDLGRELRQEQRECWRDIQHLLTEQRQVQRELSESQKRHDRTEKLL